MPSLHEWVVSAVFASATTREVQRESVVCRVHRGGCAREDETMTHQDYYEAGGVIVKGELKPVALVAFRQAMQRFPEGAHVSIKVEVERTKRSNRVNRYWHGVVIPLFAAHCGYDVCDMKDALALELLPQEVADLKTGEVRIVPGHTSMLNTIEFNELIERAQRLGATMGVYIPDPGEGHASHTAS